MSAQPPLCFVLMPFGSKTDPQSGIELNFDTIFNTAIRPAVEDAGLCPIRADEEDVGGIIHKAMFERLLLCDYAVADLTTANANVFYELGVRHAARPSTTQSIFALGPPPFDVSMLRCLPYELSASNDFTDTEAKLLRTALTKKLIALKAEKAQRDVPDSPVFQLLQNYQPAPLDHLKTDTFREQAVYAANKKNELAEARATGNTEAVKTVETNLGQNLSDVEAGVIVDLFLSYRATGGTAEMVALYDRLPGTLQRVVMLREQLGFALNRNGDREQAQVVLQGVIDEQGPSPETNGLLGRVYKDQWTEAKETGEAFLAEGYLRKAIEVYVQGYKVDIRDAYPGINAVTLLEIEGSPESLSIQKELLPAVRLAVGLKFTDSPDYWDHATMLELAVLANDKDAAQQSLADALPCVRESWEAGTTANNVTLINQARESRGVAQSWLLEVIQVLEQRARAG